MNETQLLTHMPLFLFLFFFFSNKCHIKEFLVFGEGKKNNLCSDIVAQGMKCQKYIHMFHTGPRFLWA